jgi:hypothetical protein
MQLSTCTAAIAVNNRNLIQSYETPTSELSRRLAEIALFISIASYASLASALTSLHNTKYWKFGSEDVFLLPLL